VSALYDLRSPATHGGTLKPRSAATSVDAILRENFELYVVLLKTFCWLARKTRLEGLRLGPANRLFCQPSAKLQSASNGKLDVTGTPLNGHLAI
jgi:hypothetical protein